MPVKRAVDSDSFDNRIAIYNSSQLIICFSSTYYYIAVVGFASNAMTETFMKFLIEERGFTQSEYDPCMLWKVLANGKRLDCVVHVADGFSSDDGSSEA